MEFKLGVIGSSQKTNDDYGRAIKIGREIATSGCLLLTGGCTGIPHQAVKGAKKEGGTVIGISPAANKKEHIENYQYPVKDYDTLIYTGFGLKGRNVILIRSCDGVIAGSGGMGTLNELTIAHNEDKVIGILDGAAGAPEKFEELAKVIESPKEKIVKSKDPKKLVKRVLRKLKENKKK